MMIECPRCGPEGEVLAVRIIALDRIAWICEECDALWLERCDIALESMADYGTWMESRGLPGLWSELKILAAEPD